MLAGIVKILPHFQRLMSLKTCGSSRKFCGLRFKSGQCVDLGRAFDNASTRLRAATAFGQKHPNAS
jgi:hypothetical protein